MRFRWAWWLLAYASLGTGIVGIFVPGLPTTVFILLAAYAASRGSERLHGWLVNHPRFGPMIRDWQAHGAVKRRSKVFATIAMIGCAAIVWLFAPELWIAIFATSCMIVVNIWLWFRPEPPLAPLALLAPLAPLAPLAAELIPIPVRCESSQPDNRERTIENLQ